MNTDIRLSVDFFGHHKTKRIARLLGDGAVLSLIRLFCYTGKYRCEGALTGMDAEDIADAAGWVGDRASFTKTLCDVGFLELCDEGIYRLHDWDEHNQWAAGAKARSEAASKAGLASAQKRAKSTNFSTDVQRIPTDRQRAVEKRSERISTEGQPQNGSSTPSPYPIKDKLPRSSACQMPCQSNTSSKASFTIDLSGGIAGGDGVTDDKDGHFDAFWAAYPKKVHKQDAFKAWKQKGCDKIITVIMAKLQRFISSESWTRDSGRFIPYPASWIRGERWSDELECQLPPKGEKIGGLTF